MCATALPVQDVAHVIQAAVAPVFLLSAIGAMLAVMTHRLARIVDRAREKESAHAAAAPHAAATLRAELATLSRRAKLINQAIASCTLTALLVCLVIAALFVAAFASIDAATLVAALFVGAMASFSFGLVQFLREVTIATRSLRIGPR